MCAFCYCYIGSFERPPPIKRKGAQDYYYQSITPALHHDGDTITVIAITLAFTVHRIAQ